MTAEELLNEIDDCYGPCGRICISCPMGEKLKEIREVVASLLKENHELRFQVSKLNSILYY